MSVKKKKIKLVFEHSSNLNVNDRSRLLNNVRYGDCEKTCKYCNKSYKSTAHLEKHTLLCKLKCDLSTENMTVLDDIPTPRSMYIMLLEIASKYKNLEEKYEQMNQWVVKKKKKINFSEWLNSHVETPICDNYMSYFDDIFKVTFDDIELLFNTNYNEFFNIILNKIDFTNGPITAFSNKANSIFGFIGNQWCELTKVQISSLLFRCKKTIFSKAFELKSLNKNAIAKCDKLEDKFDRLMQKLINAELADCGLYNKLRFCLYNRLKKQIKNIEEYNLVFE